MQKLLALLSVILLLSGSIAYADCITIQDGILKTSEGDIIETGYDAWGYNYQAHIFNGMYSDAFRGNLDSDETHNDIELIMKWNEAWLSNKDCDGDGILDRHYGYPDYIGSGAWFTNHQKGYYYDDNGEMQTWELFVKIEAVPSDAYFSDGVWYTDSTMEDALGPDVWGSFAITEVSNDNASKGNGIIYVSPNSAGFDSFSPQG